MTATKIYLVLSTLLWLPYGIYCLIVPEYLNEAAGIIAATPTGVTEIRAMYGGLQASIGIMCAAALVRTEMARSAMLAVAFLVSGLFLARSAGFFIDSSASEYTNGVLVFEGAYALITIFLLRRTSTT
jgi:hypothetical protein